MRRARRMVPGLKGLEYKDGAREGKHPEHEVQKREGGYVGSI